MGSTVDDDFIWELRRRMFLGMTDDVGACAPPEEEVSPAPKEDEVVVFSAHLERGLGLPVSSFFAEFLRFYGLYPHHLGANCITQLSCFVVLCEAYLGVWPSMEIFGMFFFLRSQTTAGQQRDCGGVSISAKNTPLPKINLPDSIKKWQGTYFYARNLTAVDRIGLPAFSNELPASKSWLRKPPVDGALEKVLFSRLKVLVAGGLRSRDLTLTWLSRRMYPLQARPHKLCFYSGIRDPSRTCLELPNQKSLRKWAARLITDRVEAEWDFGFEPFTRAERAPEVSPCNLVYLRFFRPAAA